MIDKEKLKLIWSLSISDFKTKYSGSAFGTIWAFVQPIITIILYWVVFQYGLRAASADPSVPYAIWLMSALVPYLFLTEAVNGVMNCYLEYNYLVKKVIFDVSMLPIIKIISSAFVHIAFVLFVLVVAGACDVNMFPGIIQLLYYFAMMIVFILSLSQFLSTVVVFFRDLSQIVNIIIQIGMWATPILWPISNAAPNIKWIFYLNPIYYITEGYRDCITGTGVDFWDKPYQTLIFMVVVLVNCLLSKRVHRKLVNQLAEVL